MEVVGDSVKFVVHNLLTEWIISKTFFVTEWIVKSNQKIKKYLYFLNVHLTTYPHTNMYCQHTKFSNFKSLLSINLKKLTKNNVRNQAKTKKGKLCVVMSIFQWRQSPVNGSESIWKFWETFLCKRRMRICQKTMHSFFPRKSQFVMA